MSVPPSPAHVVPCSLSRPPPPTASDYFTEIVTTSVPQRQLVRFDTECIVIPELGSKYYKVLAKERSRSRSVSRSRYPTQLGYTNHPHTTSEGEGEDPKERKERKRLVMQNRSYSLPLWKSPKKSKKESTPTKANKHDDERVKINFKVPIPVFERGRRDTRSSRSPSPSPTSASPPLSPILHHPAGPTLPGPSASSPTLPAAHSSAHSPPTSPSASPVIGFASPSFNSKNSVLGGLAGGSTALPAPKTIPLRPCCPDCQRATDEYLRFTLLQHPAVAPEVVAPVPANDPSSSTSGETKEWVEKWSKGAARRRRRRSSSGASSLYNMRFANNNANAAAVSPDQPSPPTAEGLSIPITGTGEDGYEPCPTGGLGGAISPTAYGFDPSLDARLSREAEEAAALAKSAKSKIINDLRLDEAALKTHPSGDEVEGGPLTPPTAGVPSPYTPTVFKDVPARSLHLATKDKELPLRPFGAALETIPGTPTSGSGSNTPTTRAPPSPLKIDQALANASPATPSTETQTSLNTTANAGAASPAIGPRKIAVDEVDQKLGRRMSTSSLSMPVHEAALLEEEEECTEHEQEHETTEGETTEQETEDEVITPVDAPVKFVLSGDTSTANLEEQQKDGSRALGSFNAHQRGSSDSSSASSTKPETRTSEQPTKSTPAALSHSPTASATASMGTSTPTTTTAPSTPTRLAPPLAKTSSSTSTQSATTSPSTSGTSTPTGKKALKGCLKNGAEGGGRILTDAEVELREARRALRRLKAQAEREREERLASAAIAASIGTFATPASPGNRKGKHRDGNSSDKENGTSGSEDEYGRKRARGGPKRWDMSGVGLGDREVDRRVLGEGGVPGAEAAAGGGSGKSAKRHSYHGWTTPLPLPGSPSKPSFLMKAPAPPTTPPVVKQQTKQGGGPLASISGPNHRRSSSYSPTLQMYASERRTASDGMVDTQSGRRGNWARRGEDEDDDADAFPLLKSSKSGTVSAPTSPFKTTFGTAATAMPAPAPPTSYFAKGNGSRSSLVSTSTTSSGLLAPPPVTSSLSMTTSSTTPSRPIPIRRSTDPNSISAVADDDDEEHLFPLPRSPASSPRVSPVIPSSSANASSASLGLKVPMSGSKNASTTSLASGGRKSPLGKTTHVAESSGDSSMLPKEEGLARKEESVAPVQTVEVKPLSALPLDLSKPPRRPGSRPGSSHSRTLSDPAVSFPSPSGPNSSSQVEESALARVVRKDKENERERRASTSTIGTLPPKSGLGAGLNRGGPTSSSFTASSSSSHVRAKSYAHGLPADSPSSSRGARGTGGRGHSEKRKTSFSLRMRALKEVGVDVLRGVSSIGMGGVRM